MSSISGQKPRDENPQMNAKGNEMTYQGRIYAIRVFDNDKPVNELPESLLNFLQNQLSKQKSQLSSNLIHLDITVDEHGDYSAYSWMEVITEELLAISPHLEVFVVPNEIYSNDWKKLVNDYNYDLEKMFNEKNIKDPELKFHIIEKYQLWQGNGSSFCKSLSKLGLTDSQRLELAELIAKSDPEIIFSNDQPQEYPIEFFEIFFDAFIVQRGMLDLLSHLDDMTRFTIEQKQVMERIFKKYFPSPSIEFLSQEHNKEEIRRQIDFIFTLFILSILDETNESLSHFIQYAQNLKAYNPILLIAVSNNINWDNLIKQAINHDKKELVQFLFASGIPIPDTLVMKLCSSSNQSTVGILLHAYAENFKKLGEALNQWDLTSAFEIRQAMEEQLHQLDLLQYPDTALLSTSLHSVASLQSQYVDKPAFHFLLDKIWRGESPFQGAPPNEYVRMLSKTLEDALVTWDQNETSISQMQKLVQSLTDAKQWSSFPVNLSESEKVTKKILGLLKDSSTNYPILIPLLIMTEQGHIVSIAIEKMEDGTARLTLYNTGYGLHYHPSRDTDPKKYQTYLTIENIPMERFLQKELWIKFFQARENIDSFYENFKNFGKISPPSSNPLDYEQQQMSGTCSAQCLMAFLRHQILNMTGGSDLLKKGTYKFLKARTLVGLGERLLSRVDQTLKPLVEKKLAKLRSDLFLAEVAKDPDQLQKYKELIFGLYKELSGQEFPNLDQLHWLEQFAFLRDCRKRIQALAKVDPSKFQTILSNKSESEIEKLTNVFGEIS